VLNAPPVRRQSVAQMFKEIGQVLTNRSLLAIMASGLVSGVAGGISSMLSSFMSYQFWGLTPQVTAVMGLLAVVGTLAGVFSAPLLSRLLDKKRTMIVLFTLSVFTGVVPVTLRLLGVLPPNGSPLIPVILTVDGIIAGALGVAGFIIVGSMVADVVEDAAVKTGVRSEGLLFAANGLLPKITTGLGSLVGGWMLEFVHFPAATRGVVQHVDPAVMRNLALISLPTGAVLNLIAIAVLGFYRINRSTHEANLEALRTAAAVTEAPTSLATGGPHAPATAAAPPI
jgi:Na+/melibiose symporter-like transporter